MPKFIVVAWLAFAPVITLAQSDENLFSQIKSELTEFRSRYSEAPVEAQVTMEVPSLEFSIDPNAENFDTVQYEPNAQVNWGLGVVIKDFGFTISVPLPLGGSDEEDDARKGRTDHFDLVLHKYWATGGVDLFFESYRGFYIDEEKSDDTEVYAQRPDVKARHIGANYYYVFAPKNYHLDANPRAVSEINNKSLKHSGSALAMASLNHHRYESDHPLLAAEKNFSSDPRNLIQAGEFLSGTVGGGYGYEAYYEKSYLRGQILIGYGPQWQKIETPKETFHRVMNGSKVSLGMDYLYFLEDWRLGFNLKYDKVEANLGSMTLESKITSVLFSATTDI